LIKEIFWPAAAEAIDVYGVYIYIYTHKYFTARRGGSARNHVYQAFHTTAPANQHNIGRSAQQAAAAAGGRGRGRARVE
jgi:hypothetical protein